MIFFVVQTKRDHTWQSYAPWYGGNSSSTRFWTSEIWWVHPTFWSWGLCICLSYTYVLLWLQTASSTSIWHAGCVAKSTAVLPKRRDHLEVTDGMNSERYFPQRVVLWMDVCILCLLGASISSPQHVIDRCHNYNMTLDGYHQKGFPHIGVFCCESVDLDNFFGNIEHRAITYATRWLCQKWLKKFPRRSYILVPRSRRPMRCRSIAFFSRACRGRMPIKFWIWPNTIPFSQQQILQFWVVRGEHCWLWTCGPLRFDNWSSFPWWCHASKWWHWCDARFTIKPWHCQCCRVFPPEFPHEFVQVVHAPSFPIFFCDRRWAQCALCRWYFTGWFIFMITSKLRSKVCWLRLTPSGLLIGVNVKRLCVRGDLNLQIEDHDVLIGFHFTFAEIGAIATVTDLPSCLDCRCQRCMSATPFCQKLNIGRGQVIAAFDKCLATDPVPFPTFFYKFFQKVGFTNLDVQKALRQLLCTHPYLKDQLVKSYQTFQWFHSPALLLHLYVGIGIVMSLRWPWGWSGLDAYFFRLWVAQGLHGIKASSPPGHCTCCCVCRIWWLSLARLRYSHVVYID